MSTATATPPRIVRETHLFSYCSCVGYHEQSICDMIATIENRTFQVALQEGYTQMEVSRMWDVYYGDPQERPGWLVGPGAPPPPKSLAECWALDMRDNPVAKYTVVIREMNSSGSGPATPSSSS